MSISFWKLGKNCRREHSNNHHKLCCIHLPNFWRPAVSLRHIAVHRLTQCLGISVGDLICPMYHELCDDPVPSMPGQCPHDCHQNGDCNNGKCTCFLGYSGDHCSERKSLFYWTLDEQGTCEQAVEYLYWGFVLFRFLDNCRGGNANSHWWLSRLKL